MSRLLNLQIALFLLVAVGFLVRKCNIIGQQGQKNLNDMVIYVILPCNILNAFTNSQAEGMFQTYISILLISLGIQIFSVVYGNLLFGKESENHAKNLKYGTICSNAGFLGNPIAEGLYGAEGLALASIYLIPQRIMMWTSGLSIYSGSTDLKATLKKLITHPCIIANGIGIVMMLLKLQFPGGLGKAITSIANCNTAMSMMVIGMILAEGDFKDFWDWSVVKFTIHRLVIIPLVVYLVCKFLPLSKEVCGLCVILAAMPAGATTSILAEKYEVDPGFATKLVIFSTICSLPTICIWSMLLH